jgi:hypothetical protein
LLEWFYQIKKTTEPITYSEIKAWDDLTESHVTPEEVKILMRLDLEYNFQNKKHKKPDENNPTIHKKKRK